MQEAQIKNLETTISSFESRNEALQEEINRNKNLICEMQIELDDLKHLSEENSELLGQNG